MRSLLLLLPFLLYLLAGCDAADPYDDGTFDVPPERLVALTAVYAETDSNGVYPQRIVLVDYANPSRYKVLTEGHVSIQPRFSPDKTRLLYGDETTGTTHAPQFVLYDLTTEEATPFSMPPDPFGFRPPVFGEMYSVVWDAQGSGFYYTEPVPAFAIIQNVYFFALAEQMWRVVHDGNGYSVYPRDLKGSDTLIVFSNEQFYTGQGPLGMYFMDLDGNYLAHLDNPHLELINRDGINKKAAYSPSWNDEVGLFAIARSDSTRPGYRIAVTDLSGGYYREYTSGDYIDDNPRWGPGGDVILFDRIEIEDYSYTGYRVMVADLKTGEVRELVKPSAVDGAVALRFPDY